MELPQPNADQLPNVEVLWAGDIRTGHLNVSIRVGTFFGITNAFAERIAHDVTDCDELCQCDIHADTGDLMASFHVGAPDWPDFAHAMLRKVFLYVTQHPKEWNQRDRTPAESHMAGDKFVVAAKHRVN